MGRIAAITASNASYQNMGMISVDLALEGVLRRAGLAASTSWFSLELPDVLPLRRCVDATDLPFSPRTVEDHLEEIYQYDAIVVWGDFLQARHYYVEDLAKAMQRRHRLSGREALDRLIDLFLFRGAPEHVLPKVLCFGGSLLYNSQAALSDRAYGEALQRLVRGARGVWMRDPISAIKIVHQAGGDESSHLGCDAAFLLSGDDVDALRRTGWSDEIPAERRIGVFVGSRTPLGAEVFDFCQRLGERLGLEMEWLPWMEPSLIKLRSWGHPIRTGRRVRLRNRASQLLRAGDYSVGDVLSAVGRYRLIVTDTYHLAINAWRAGTPAICIGSRQPRVLPGPQTLNDMKKHVLYLMYEATDLYLTPEDIGRAGPRRANAQRLAEFVADAGSVEAIAARIRRQSQAAEAQFLSSLRALL